MDLGVDGFLDKFEKHFGGLATKVFLLLIGSAIGIFSLGTIWQWLVWPVIEIFRARAPWSDLFLTFVLGTLLGILYIKIASPIVAQRLMRLTIGKVPAEERQLKISIKQFQLYLKLLRERQQDLRRDQRDLERDQRDLVRDQRELGRGH